MNFNLFIFLSFCGFSVMATDPVYRHWSFDEVSNNQVKDHSGNQVDLNLSSQKSDDGVLGKAEDGAILDVQRAASQEADAVQAAGRRGHRERA